MLLSADYVTAVKVGTRHGKPVVYQIDTRKMQEDEFEFYISANNVWLVKNVPFNYLRRT